MAPIIGINTRLQTMSVSIQKEEYKKAPVVLMEDNLTKAKRALMVTKHWSPLGRNVQELESKAQIEAADRTTILKLRETLIRKSREYHTTFPKYNGYSKQGQAWCAAICYHELDYKVETASAEEVKFAIYGAIERFEKQSTVGYIKLQTTGGMRSNCR